MVTKNDVYGLLSGLGLKSDSNVMMHTSLKAIGEIEGRAEGLLDYFCSYLSDGIFAVPTGTWSSGDYFDAKTTVPCTGVFTEICAREAFRRENGVRSVHPSHSVAAFGKNAAEFVKGEENFMTTPTPKGGVWSRLYDINAFILLVGVGFNRNTYIHATDEELNIPNRLRDGFTPKTVMLNDGSIEKIDNYRGHGFNSWDYFPNFEKPLYEMGCVRYSMLGNAKVTCMDVRKSRPIIYRMWERADYDLCGETKEIPKELYM